MYKLKLVFLNFLLKLSSKINNKNKKKPKKHSSANNSFGKKTMNSAATVEFNIQNNNLKNEVLRISEKIIKKYFGNVNKTIKILEKKNIKFYRTKYAVKILKKINEKQGFITPLKGFKAFYLNFFISLICEKKLSISFKTKEMFIFAKGEINTYYLAAQVYKFVAFRKKMPGFEYATQEKFKKIYMRPNNKRNINSLTAGEIFALKEAIARDVESIDFAENLLIEKQGIDKESKVTL